MPSSSESRSPSSRTGSEERKELAEIRKKHAKQKAEQKGKKNKSKKEGEANVAQALVCMMTMNTLLDISGDEGSVPFELVDESEYQVFQNLRELQGGKPRTVEKQCPHHLNLVLLLRELEAKNVKS
jgi:hypothetical protein